MMNKNDVNIFTAIAEDYYDPNYIFDADKGLNLAVTMSDPFNLSDDHTIDPAYGRIRILHWKWAFDPDHDQINFVKQEIETHRCTYEELGLKGSSYSKFMPIIKR